MQIVIEISDELRQADQDPTSPVDPRSQLADKANELGLVLTPLHPGSGESSLSKYLVAEAPDRTSAEMAASALRSIRGVTAAYTKEPEAPA